MPGADLGPIWQHSPLLGVRKLAPKKTFSCEKQICICQKKTLIYIKGSLKGSKEFHFKLFLALVLASGTTRRRLGVSEHPRNPQFQGLKIDLFGYRCPNYFSWSAPECCYGHQDNSDCDIVSEELSITLSKRSMFTSIIIKPITKFIFRFPNIQDFIKNFTL